MLINTSLSNRTIDKIIIINNSNKIKIIIKITGKCLIWLLKITFYKVLMQ